MPLPIHMPLATSLTIPDLWQQEAVSALQAGRDVVVQAPTGSGKTFIFELLLRAGWKKRAVYTVPTRALANDKRYEWQTKGWNVGISTGDISLNLDAPVVVATLETQKEALMRGEGPDLLVIDEYQMLGDESRGLNYELAVAAAPAKTQLLLLSGSVGNPEAVARWMERLGRKVTLVRHDQRPVPLEEIFAHALPDQAPNGIRGFWPRLIARALMADLGPILIFAPRRNASETLARELAEALPLNDLMALTPEQKAIADEPLLKLLKHRIAYHHSGLSYAARAGLVEPLAKAGQLRVVVSTMGLASGINFSMRSVLVTDRTYQSGRRLCEVRPDQLLQMFGRAGRRGLDDKGYVLVVPEKPRLSEAKPLFLKRAEGLDWSAFLARMHHADRVGEDPAQAALQLSQRLFCERAPETGLSAFLKRPPTPNAAPMADADGETPPVPMIREMLNYANGWERCRPPVRVKLKSAFIRSHNQWKSALSDPRTLSGVSVGQLCRLSEKDRPFGRRVPIAAFHKDKRYPNALRLSKWIFRAVYFPDNGHCDMPPKKYWSIEEIEKNLLPRLPLFTQGGTLHAFSQEGEVLYAMLDYSQATVFARIDAECHPLVDTPQREVAPPQFPSFREIADGYLGKPRAASAPADIWHALGLIDHRGRPTRRGIIASFFHQAEGIAVAAALEEKNYPANELAHDLANLRAGFRFADYDSARVRLGTLCRLACRGQTFAGYLDQGLPLDYGDGASEVFRRLRKPGGAAATLTTQLLRTGDIERARLEWRSLLRRIAHAPDFPWDRWRALQKAAAALLEKEPKPFYLEHIPALSPEQRKPRELRAAEI